MNENNLPVARIHSLHLDFSIAELDHPAWQQAEEVSVEKYWSGQPAPPGRHARARLLWSQTALYVRFDAEQTEPLVVSAAANPGAKTLGLWERDVCEIFVAPNPHDRRRYFEFEVAPNGDWIDLAVHQLPDRRETDWDYSSGMKSAARIEADRVVMALKIEWPAFDQTPVAGDVWLGNLLRCVGSGPTRGYLAWSPTGTEQPNFHVPEAFGRLEFAR